MPIVIAGFVLQLRRSGQRASLVRNACIGIKDRTQCHRRPSTSEITGLPNRERFSSACPSKVLGLRGRQPPLESTAFEG
jgi:hypothetical protein